MMRRLIRRTLALALCLLPLHALAQGVTVTQTAQRLYPDGATEESASYILRFDYPRFEDSSDVFASINAYYEALSQDLLASEAPDEAALPGEPAHYLNISYSLTCDTGDYLGVLLTSRQYLGNAEAETLTGNVFAKTGVYAGQPLTLSQVTGLEQSDGENSYAAQLAYQLVWQVIGDERAMAVRQYLDDLTQEELKAAFDPETDFYMDESENLVFYIQPGILAGEVEGTLTYPFSVSELLSAAK